MTHKTPITVALGDGIGPEIMQATLAILAAAGAAIEPEFIELGEKIYLQGNTSGIGDEAWDSLRRTQVLLKAPITTPQGGGYKSLNVTIRKTLGLYANIRPCRAYAPFITTHFPKTDLVIIRENEEDLYAGIEYRQTAEVVQCLKLISRPGCEKIIRYAFEYARCFNRKKVACFTKDNIMKMTDGLFHKIFNEIGQEYPELQQEHYIVDIGTALLAADPEHFDVIVTENLYGDIISDVAAQVVGSVGLAGSANIGNHVAMFEAIHGSAPDIAGKNIANPSGLLHSAIQLLVHIKQPSIATRIENAWLKTIEEGIHTADIYQTQRSQQKVGTAEFARAVIARLGQQPTHFAAADYQHQTQHKIVCVDHHDDRAANKVLVGVDIYLDYNHRSPEKLATALQQLRTPLLLEMIVNRGIKVWPDGAPDTYCSDHWRCRYLGDRAGKRPIAAGDIIGLLTECQRVGLDCIKTENLYTFDGERGFTLAQGQ